MTFTEDEIPCIACGTSVYGDDLCEMHGGPVTDEMLEAYFARAAADEG